MAARASDNCSVLQSVFENSFATGGAVPKLVYQNAAAQSKSQPTFAAILGDKAEEAAAALSADGRYSTILHRRPEWWKLDATVVGSEIMLSESDVSDLVGEAERKDQQFRRVCHDLRAPLHGIVGLSESIVITAKRARSDPTNALAIMHEGQRLAFMINDILDSSKLKAGKMGLNLKSLRVKDEVEKVVHSLRSAKDQSTGNPLVARAVALRNEVDADLPFVLGDKHRLSQILYNIIGNACKFTKTGSVRVLAKKLVNSSGEFVQVDIKDTGVGIKETDIGKLFQEFAQVDNSDSREFAGTGLGLAICKELVELHGGTVVVDSVWGQGSTFSFTLPTSSDVPTPDEADADIDAWLPSDNELDDLFGGDATWGTGSFRYGTGGLASGRYDKLVSLMKQATFLKEMSFNTGTMDRAPVAPVGTLARNSKGLLQQMTDAEREEYLKTMYRWFVGSMDRYEAAKRLEQFPVGSFLVRKGTRDYVISVRYMRHGDKETLFNVEIHSAEEPHPTLPGVKTMKYFVINSTKFSDLPSLVEYYMGHSELFFSNLADARDYHNERLLPCEVIEEHIS